MCERHVHNRLELVGGLLRAAQRPGHLENDQQRGEGKEVVDWADAVVLERKADREHEQLRRLHEEVGREMGRPHLRQVVGLREHEQQAGEGGCDREHDEHRVAHEIADGEDAVSRRQGGGRDDLPGACVGVVVVARSKGRQVVMGAEALERLAYRVRGRDPHLKQGHREVDQDDGHE